METIKSIFIIYLFYLILDALLRFWKLFAIIAEYGLFSTINGTISLLRIYLKKLFGDDSNWMMINFYKLDSKIATFTDILLYPTRIIDNFSKKLLIICSILKAAKCGIAIDELMNIPIDSQLRIGFANSAMPKWSDKVPIIGPIGGNILFIFEYHIILILELFPKRVIDGIDPISGDLMTRKGFNRDIFGGLSLPKLIRLIFLELITFSLFLIMIN